MTNFGAGHETMASTLTNIIALVGSHPEVQDHVGREMRVVDSGRGLGHCYVRAVIKESERLRPVASMSLPRTVPASGLHVHGCFFPPGTIVGCNPVSLHRNPDICGADPNWFRPERWLDKDRAIIMERHSLAWGGGARSCPGRHLAEMMVSKIVPELLRDFTVEVEIPPEEEMPSYFLSMMTGVKVRFLEKQDCRTRI